MSARLILAATVAFAVSVPSQSVDLTVTAPDGVELAGTIHRPRAAERYPAIVFTHGSEPGVRKGYAAWAEPFVARGIAVVVFDKRGCGESEGTYVEAPDLDRPAGDVLAWVDLLVADAKVSSIGVLGWSQGGWVGPLAASRSPHIDCVVAISGAGVSPLEQNIYDKTNRAAATGLTPAQVARFERTLRAVWTYLATGEGREAAQRAWDENAGEAWFERVYRGAPMMDRDVVLRDVRMREYPAHACFDPAPVLAKLRVPMLAVFGERDRIVPVERSRAAMTAAARSAGFSLTVQVVPGGDHGLRGGERPVSEVRRDIVAWAEAALANAAATGGAPPEPVDHHEPAWSPDGDRIVFQAKRRGVEGGNFELYTVRPDGGDLRRLTDNEFDDGAASWSADGDSLFWPSGPKGARG
ncbi:MAG: alpha/beta fold hydrolase, partial [Planctomycetes bacterium]|nr:alpha/beta fold hydrolase [Planctomycetota bacterium]